MAGSSTSSTATSCGRLYTTALTAIRHRPDGVDCHPSSTIVSSGRTRLDSTTLVRGNWGAMTGTLG
jgi:hypothetical protein